MDDQTYKLLIDIADGQAPTGRLWRRDMMEMASGAVEVEKHRRRAIARAAAEQAMVDRIKSELVHDFKLDVAVPPRRPRTKPTSARRR